MPQNKKIKPIPKLSKQQLLPLLAIITYLILAAGTIILITRISSRTALQKLSAVPYIAVPAEGGFVEAWTPLLPRIAETTGLTNVSIRTYSDGETLTQFFAEAVRDKLLFAEIPVDTAYNLPELTKKGYLTEIGTISDTIIPPVFTKSLSSLLATDKNFFLPLSCNPWILITLREHSAIQPVYSYAIPGQEDDGMFASLALAARDAGSMGSSPRFAEFLVHLKKMANDGTIQINAGTYTYNDAYQFLSAGKAKYLLFPVSEYSTLSTAERMTLSVQPLQKQFICDMTVAAFPVQSFSEAQLAKPALIELLKTSEIQYSLAQPRKYLSANIISPAKSASVDTIKRQLSLASQCLFPKLLDPAEKKSADLADQIRGSLMTLQENVK
jgi:hypothetical protein